MRFWFIFAALIVLMRAGPASAQGAESAATAFVGVQQLSLSPGGKYVFAVDEFHTITVAETACLVTSGGACRVSRLWTENYFEVNEPYFSRDDRYLYMGAMGITPEKTPNGTLTISEIEIAALLRGERTPRRTFTLQLPSSLKHSMDIETDVSGWSTTAANAYFARITPIVAAAVRGDSKRPDNVSNVFGRLSGDRAIALRRDDQDYFVHCSRNGGPERLLWKNGSAFESRRTNLPIRFDGKDAMVLTRGSVLRLTGCSVRDETKGLPRALLIQGDDPSGYYGFATAFGARPRHVTPRLARLVERAVEAVAGEHVMGIAVSNRHGSAIVSHGPFFRQEQRQRPNGTNLEITVAGYRHDLYFGGRKISLIPPGKPIATHKVIAVDGGKLFVERYSRPENRKNVVFLYGGPGLYANFEQYAFSDMLAILDAGANLDIFHYGGSSYTFALKDHLYRGGTASLARDSQRLEDYVFAHYKPRDFVSLHLRSFGGTFYRFMSPKLLHRFNNVVLDAPAGSYSDYPGSLTPLAYKFNQMNLGQDTAAEARKYYAGLTGCQLVRKVTLIVGKKDDLVDPDYAYRFCKETDKLEIIRHDGDHMEATPNASPADMQVYRLNAAKLTADS